MLIGSIDVGSSTIRLLAVEAENGRIKRQILNLREMTRLGAGLKEGGRLSAGSKARTLEVLREFSGRLSDAGVEHVSAVATEALRIASDSTEFVAEVRRETGLDLEVISWEEEARRTLLGIRSGMKGHDIEGWKLLIDIGGGSTELITTMDWQSRTIRSLPLGAVSLYEKFLRLREKLQKEGLFDADAKRAIPEHPRQIGVVTSLAAAALRDVLTTLRRRNASIPVIVYPTAVQGAGAGPSPRRS